LSSADTKILNLSKDGSTANGAFMPLLTCPVAVNGSVTVTDTTVIPYFPGINAVEIIGDGKGNDDGVCEPTEDCKNTYLINAVEVIGDFVGDDDGLCESNEACIYSPNYGFYQGEGDYRANSPCVFQNGTVTGVIMYGYPTNGL
jgi:hypothetical protein